MVELRRLVAEYASREGIPPTDALVEGVNEGIDARGDAALTVEEFIAIIVGAQPAARAVLGG